MIRRASFSAFFCLASLLFGSKHAICEEAELAKDAIQRIHQDIQAEEVRLQEIKDAYSIKDKELKELRLEDAQLQSQKDLLIKEVNVLRKEEREVSSKIVEADSKIVELRAVSFSRIRALYEYKPQTVLGTLLTAGDSGSFTKAFFYLDRIRAHDNTLIGALSALAAEVRARKVKLSEIISDKEKVDRELGAKKEKIRQNLGEQTRIVEQLKIQKLKFEDSLTQLRAKALRFETVMSSLMGGGNVEAPRPRRTEQASLNNRTFEGPGLTSKKRLISPIVGRIVRMFGSSKRGSSDVVFNKGIEILSPIGTQAKAISAGVVAYLGRLPAYGTVVIIDHGRRYYSLYGRLATVGVKNGDIVSEGQEIGQVGEPDSKSRNFYFEIRVNGSAVNPLNFVSKPRNT